jgi:Uma2 family endonuclease
MTVAAMSPDVQERVRRLSVEEYHRIVEAGILGEDENVQLIDGVLVAMTPQGRRHAFVIQELNRQLVLALGEDYRVLTQLPLALGGDSEPEPDLAVLRARDAASTTRHPGTALLVVEVADESLRFDRHTKSALYARAGIPEYWIVNLVEMTIEIHRDPDPDSASYRSVSPAPRGAPVTARSVPGVVVDLQKIIG